MAGFLRRFGFFPSNDVITQIEGVVIVDLPPPGSPSGTGVGTFGIVGEFQDCTFATALASGVVSTKLQPVEIFSAQDMLQKLGGFDETIGDTGVSGGSGFIALRNKKFSRLIVAPLNLASTQAARMVRQLPTNKSVTVAQPIVPTVAGLVAAGLQFLASSNRVRTAARKVFTALGQYLTGTDLATTASVPAATQTISSAGSNFLTANNGAGVQVGDIVVVGVIGGASANGFNAGTYRVHGVTDATDLVIEQLDGSNFTSANWESGTAMAFRIHPASDADTAGVDSNPGLIGAAAGFTVPARPLDATITTGTSLAPANPAAAGTATSWQPLSGLTMLTQGGGGGGLTYTAAIQGANAASSSSTDAAYVAGLAAMLSADEPAASVNLICCARTSATIRATMKSHVETASSGGVGRTGQISPEINQTSESTVVGSSDPGVGANRDERIDYAWPGVQTFIPEAVNFGMKGADGVSYTNGLLDTKADTWLASVLSVLPPERNPGQAGPPGDAILANILGVQRGVGGLQMSDYISLRAAGIVGIRMDKTVGPIFQSGVTTSLTTGQKNINRRRMADYIEDSLADVLKPFVKQLANTAMQDSAVGEVNAFLKGLLSVNNPAAQRIAAFSVDDKSGNTQDMTAQGIFVIIVKVQSLFTADFIVLQASVGEDVQITTT